MSYPRLIHDTRKQNKIQPETHCGDTCDMSKSQVRHIHDPVSSIDRDRNYNISITMTVYELQCLASSNSNIYLCPDDGLVIEAETCFLICIP